METYAGFRASTAAGGPDGRIYAVGSVEGDGGNPWFNGTFLAYDPEKEGQADAWEKLPSVPGGGLWAQAVTAVDGRIYVISDGRVLEAFDTCTKTWSRLAPLLVPHGGIGNDQFAAALGPDNRLYVLGGSPGGRHVEAYDPVENRWSPMPPMSATRMNLAAVTGADRRIYAIAGNGFPSPDQTVEAFDVCTNLWTPVDDLNHRRPFHLGAVSAGNNRIYAVGGGPRTIETFDATANRPLGVWRDVEGHDLPGEEHWNYATTEGIDGRIYVVGFRAMQIYTPDLSPDQKLDVPPACPSLSVDDPDPVPEAVGRVTFTVSLDVPASVPVRVDYYTADDDPPGPGHATAGPDYRATAGQLTFAPGERTKTVAVPVVTDADKEPSETFSLKLSPPAGPIPGALLGDGVGAGTIVDPAPATTTTTSTTTTSTTTTSTTSTSTTSTTTTSTTTTTPSVTSTTLNTVAALATTTTSPPSTTTTSPSTTTTTQAPPPPVRPPLSPALVSPASPPGPLQPLPLPQAVLSAALPLIAPAPVPPTPPNQPLSQPQVPTQTATQSQVQQQIQQQIQAQMQTGMAAEREREHQVERAVTDRRDANPETYLASARRRPLPVPVTVGLGWVAALMTTGVALSHTGNHPAPAPNSRAGTSSARWARRRPCS